MFEKINKRDRYQINDVVTEYDEDAVINTYGENFKRIEFLGFDKIWERLQDMGKVQELGLNSLKISHFGKAGEIGKLCGNLRNLYLEKNLLRNWEQVFALGKELRNLEMLSISFNNLELSPNWTERETLRSFNSEGETIPFKKDTLEYFPKLEKIVLIETNMTFKKLNQLIDYFPKVTELVLPNNQCNDFDEIEFEKYRNIDSLNLEANDIDTEQGHKLDALTKLGKLEKLCIIKNNIKRILCAEKFEKLTHLNISENNISDGIILRDIRKMPNIESIRSMRNILNDVHTYRHLRQWVIAELPTIDTYNGAKLKKLERKDSELYIMRWGFHEYFRVAKEN